MTIIDVSPFGMELHELEALHYEVNSRAQIISMLIRENQLTTQGYKIYSQEYAKYFTEYSKAKDNFSSQHLPEGYAGSWEINFEKKELRLLDA